MPKIIKTNDMKIVQEDGWQVVTLADAAIIGYPAMVAKWWTFQAGVSSPLLSRGNADELLYVINGSGQAIVQDETFPLDVESVLWLEDRDSYQLIAGEGGLEILQAYAPGDKIDG